MGIEITQEDGLVKVVSPIEDTPAYRGGVKSGDLIYKLDDTFVKGLTLEGAVALKIFLAGFIALRFLNNPTGAARHFAAVAEGSRSAITGADAPHPRHMAVLVDGLHRKFPALKGIAIDHSWWGWVDVSHDMMPRITQPDSKQSVWYALGYGGNGVSFSTWAGKRLAERITGQDAGREVFNLPIYKDELTYPHFLQLFRSEALAPFRRIGQRFLYKWYWWQDEM